MQVAELSQNPENHCGSGWLHTRVNARTRESEGSPRVRQGSKGGVAIRCLRNPDPMFTGDVNPGSEEQSLHRTGGRCRKGVLEGSDWGKKGMAIVGDRPQPGGE